MSIVMPFVCPVAGISQYQEAAAQVRVGQALRVCHEPGNPYDANACRVESDAGLLGYVPAPLAARLVRTGSQWLAEVDQVLSGQQCLGIRMRVLGVVAAESESASAPAGLSIPSSSDGPGNLGELACPDAQGPQCGPGEPVRMVRALSGRVLGELVEDRAQSQLVRVSDRVVEYPKSLLQA